MALYTVSYFMSRTDKERFIDIEADNRDAAIYKATYNEIPRVEGSCPYEAHVDSVLYKNGKRRHLSATTCY